MNAFLSESQSLSLFLLGAKQIADAIWGRSPLSGGLNKTLLSPSFVSPTMKKSNHTRKTFARPLESFRSVPPSYCIEYDASLKGLGVILRDMSTVDEDNQDGSIMKVASLYPLPFDLKNDPSYQNVVEFLAVILGMIMMRREGLSNVTIKLKGDSKSSLKWGSTELFKGNLVQRASIVFILLGVHANITVEESEHWAGLLNVRCDRLSRGTRPEDLDVHGTSTNC